MDANNRQTGFALTPPTATAPKPSKIPARRGRKAIEHREPTQQELDLFHLSLEIDQKNAREHDQIGYIATAMIHASLPHSKVDGAIFKRRNGDLQISILNDPDIGLPYGKMPRVITAFLCTEAKLKQNPEIHLGRSQAEFAKKLGLSTGGGPNGDITRLKEQARRLFTSHITLLGDPNQQFHWRNVNITNGGMLLWNPHNPHERGPWESKLMLSLDFFNECVQHGVPIDLRVLQKLRSPLAIDIYVWMTYRYHVIKHPTPISWKQLKWQFGSNYSDDEQGLHNFISNFKAALRKVAAVYRAAKFNVGPYTLTLLPSPTHVPPAPERD
ncbi:replication protein RepA [Xanthomonas citri]